jgi:hypothetical protein
VNWLSLPCRVRRHSFEETTVWDMLPMSPNLTLMTVSLNGFRVPSQLLWVEPQLRCVLMMSSWSTHNTTVQAHVVWKELWESSLLISDTSWLLLCVQASGFLWRLQSFASNWSFSQITQNDPQVSSFQ